MESSKFTQLIQRISPEERQACLDFIRHYPPQDEFAVDVAHHLVQCLNRSRELPSSKLAFFKAVFPDKHISRKEINYTLSRLNKVAETFLAWNNLSARKDLVSLAKLKVFSLLELDKHFKAEAKRLQKALLQPGIKGAEDFLLQTEYFTVQDEHYIRKKVRREDKNIQLATKALDTYYYTKKLQFACSMLDRKHIIQVQVDHDISPEWLVQLQQSPAHEEPMIQLYLNIFRALQREDEEGYFWELKERLWKAQTIAKPEVLGEIAQFSINYCARKIRQGKQKFVREALDLYRVSIEKQWLFNKGILSPWAYTNVVKLSLRLKEYELARAFIEKYERFLPEEFRENALNYNLAELLYYTEEKAAAQEHLLRVAYSDLNYYLGARVLLAKIYFETGEEEVLLSHLAAFTMFLQRNKKISKDLQITFLNFCRILTRILRRKAKDADRLLQMIDETKLLSDREWLKEITCRP